MTYQMIERSLSDSFTFWDLEFSKEYIVRYSSTGTPFLKAVLTGMPRLPDRYLDTAFYLYDNEDNARTGSDSGGTGFVVSIPSESHPDKAHYCYAVTNRHVLSSGSTVVRLNTVDGASSIIPFGLEDWTVHPDGYDIAAVPIPLDLKNHNLATVNLVMFATEDQLRTKELGVGDNVFMIGRFVDHDGGEINRPAARFGCISVLPSRIYHDESNKYLDSYCLDMNSRSGYSGSPVFVYQTPFTNLDTIADDAAKRDSKYFLSFLGIHWGQVPEKWKVKEKTTDGVSVPVHSELEVKGLSGMTLVDPSWKIKELLMLDNFKAVRREHDEKLVKTHGPSLGSSLESAPMESVNSHAGDDILRTMLNTPPAPVTKSTGKPTEKKTV